MALKRISKQILDIQKQPSSNWSVEQTKQDIFRCQGTIIGREGSPYAQGIFFIDIKFPNDYPFKPPKVEFQTKIYHPNINNNSTLRLDIFYQWSAAFTISKVMTIIEQLLNHADADNPLEPQIAKIYKENKQKFDKTAKQWTEKFAK